VTRYEWRAAREGLGTSSHETPATSHGALRAKTRSGLFKLDTGRWPRGLPYPDPPTIMARTSTDYAGGPTRKCRALFSFWTDSRA